MYSLYSWLFILEKFNKEDMPCKVLLIILSNLNVSI